MSFITVQRVAVKLKECRKNIPRFLSGVCGPLQTKELQDASYEKQTVTLTQLKNSLKMKWMYIVNWNTNFKKH